MTRTSAPIGTEHKQPNGYVMVKTEEGWRYKHHIVAEQMLGRPLTSDERVIFTNGTRDNPTPKTIEVVKSKSRRTKLQELQKKVSKMQSDMETIAQILEKELASDSSE